MTKSSDPCSPHTLFLHWGPGSHARVEKGLLGEGLGVHWWDQPSPSIADAFEGLIDAGVRETEDLARANGGPVCLLAHSFGGELAYQISLRVPERISRIALLGSSAAIDRAFLSLARNLPTPSSELSAAIRAAENTPRPEAFWPLVQALAAAPDLILHYWAPSSTAARDAYFAEASRHPGMDFDVFGRVLTGYFAARAATAGSQPSPFRGEVELHLGSADPLIVPDAEVADWTNRFPSLKTHVHPCGHFIHFERPKSEWWE